jgi:7-dehydrocholesterol reductase
VYGIYDPARVYDMMGHLLGSMNLFAIFFCLFLTVKGLYFPSTKDSGTNGSWIMDYFWGTELYPNILGWDVKEFTNCRFGMMFWQIGIICYLFAQYNQLGYVDGSMLVSVIVQSVYIFKFFLWETGYFCSMDIQHDRAGYYICYGCLCWVPSIYTFHTFYLVENPMNLSLVTTLWMTLWGLLFVWINYDCDRQRQLFRASGGKFKIWGEDSEYIEATYTTEDGNERTNLLLSNGWWGMSRHIHYVPEILASVMWCVPYQTTTCVPYFYPFYLTLLLLDRAWRDDKRCADKYGEYWQEYCEIVPYKIIPGVI